MNGSVEVLASAAGRLPRRVVVWNGRAGTAASEAALRAIEPALARGDVALRDVGLGADVTALARAAVDEGAEVVVAAGGDGTVSAVADALAGSRAALGILPLGTLNHFAKDLGVPLDPADALAAIERGRVVLADVGEVNGRVFVNNASLGLYPRIVSARERQREMLGRGKWPALFWATLAVLRRYRLLEVSLRVDGRPVLLRTPFLFVGNNEYAMERLSIGARSCLDAGRLSLYAARETTRFGLLRLALGAIVGRLRRASDFRSDCAGEIVVERRRRRRVRIAIDGEVVRMTLPLHFRSRPQALRVLVPEARREERSTAFPDET